MEGASVISYVKQGSCSPGVEVSRQAVTARCILVRVCLSLVVVINYHIASVSHELKFRQFRQYDMRKTKKNIPCVGHAFIMYMYHDGNADVLQAHVPMHSQLHSQTFSMSRQVVVDRL